VLLLAEVRARIGGGQGIDDVSGGQPPILVMERCEQAFGCQDNANGSPTPGRAPFST